MGAVMDIVQAYEILQDSSSTDSAWQNAKSALGHHIMTDEGLAWARASKYYDGLMHVYIRMIERLAEPYDGPKGEEGAGRESQKGVYGSYIWPVTEQRVVGRISLRTKQRAKDLVKREAKRRASDHFDAEHGHSATNEASETRAKDRKEDREVHEVCHTLVDAHETVGGRYVDDLSSGTRKTQKRTLDNVQRMVKGDNMLLRQEATYEDVLRYHGGDPDDPKSRNSAQQRISRARAGFVRWARDIPDQFYLEGFNKHVSASTLVEKVVEVLTRLRKALQ